MFKKNTYITRGIKNNLDENLVLLLWSKVMNVSDRELDYLQVFELKNVGVKDQPILEVKWSQEVPEHFEKFFVKGIKTNVDKVWIICSGEGTEEEYSTMLLPEEY